MKKLAVMLSLCALGMFTVGCSPEKPATTETPAAGSTATPPADTPAETTPPADTPAETTPPADTPAETTPPEDTPAEAEKTEAPAETPTEAPAEAPAEKTE